MNAAQLVLIGIEVLIVGAIAAAVTSGRRRVVGTVAFLFTLLAGVLVFPAAWGVLLGQTAPITATLWRVPTIGAELSFRVDSLSAFFLLLTSAVSVLTTLYSTGYMPRYTQQHMVRYYPLLLLFFAAITAVVASADWFFFLLFWEAMTVCSYFLVVFEREAPGVSRAGLKYLLVTHAATGLMLIGIVVVHSQVHSFSFAAVHALLTQWSISQPGMLHLVFALWFIAFATKAGLLPFGDWLPDAYAAAPTSASAAFGGTMTKLAIYGLLRVFVDLAPASDVTSIWGVVIAVFGAGSIFMGTLTALAQNDSKRLMSWHVIGQMGYILLAIGTGIYLLPNHPALATLALLAGLFHLLNNVCYKSVLFMNAGSVLLRTGERDLNRLSGLWSVMPITAVTAVIASLSIAGAPPLNGFASKWMIYQITVLGTTDFPVFVVLGAVAAFISLVTLASFLKFLGGSFLGAPSLAAQKATGDVPAVMQIPQLVLAGCCVLFGLVPMLPLLGIYQAIRGIAGIGVTTDAAQLLGTSWLGVRLSLFSGATTGVWLPIVGLISLTIAVLLAQGFARLGASERRRVDIWNCGTRPLGEQSRFPAHSLYGAFKTAFHDVYPKVKWPEQAGYPTRFMEIFNLDRWLFQPALRAGVWVTEVVSHTHSGIPQLYLSWQLAGLVIVVVVLFWWAR